MKSNPSPAWRVSGELRSNLIDLGDKKQKQEGIRFNWSNDDVRVATEVSQARNHYNCATAIQEYSARGRHELRPFNADRAKLRLKAVGFWLAACPVRDVITIRVFGLSRGCAHQQKQPLNLRMP